MRGLQPSDCYHTAAHTIFEVALRFCSGGVETFTSQLPAQDAERSIVAGKLLGRTSAISLYTGQPHVSFYLLGGPLGFQLVLSFVLAQRGGQVARIGARGFAMHWVAYGAQHGGALLQVAATMAVVMIGIVGFVFVTVPAFSPVHEHPTWQGLAVTSGTALVARHPELVKSARSTDVVKPGPSVADVTETAKTPSFPAQKLVQASTESAKVPRLHPDSTY